MASCPIVAMATVLMNLAALIQSQTFATLLSALSSESGLAVGKTVEARLLTLDSDGTATALVNGVKIALVLSGPEAKQAPLQPGATLMLRIDAPDEAGGSLRATLLETHPPAAGAPQASPPDAPRGTAPAPIPAPVGGSPPTPGGLPAAQPVSGQAPGQVAPPVLVIAGQPAPAAPSPQVASIGPALIIAPQRPAEGAQPNAPAANPVPHIDPAASPRALAGPLLGQALGRQDSLAPLFANLRQLASGSVALVLPKPLLQMAEQILAQAVPAERRPITAPMLQTAIARSGLFLEAREASAASTRPAEGAPSPVANMPPQPDLKAGLRALKAMLQPLVAPEAARAAPAETARPLPGRTAAAEAYGGNQEQQGPRPAAPQRDGTLAPQPIAAPSLAAAEKPAVIAQTLLEQTEAALDRVSLSQFASLPPEGQRTDAQQNPRWLTEIPLAFQAGTAIMPLQIERDPPQRGGANPEAPIWRMRFALDVEPMGPLQGVVTLQGRAVGVSLWAEREATSEALRGAVPDLQAALANARFEDGVVDVHTGQPHARRAAAGQFLDRLS
ncbi:flagellar hook-length control protein FliK [Bosea caraganae]|uniref:Flagellar hook-length control protein FliK n=1 Tax=Bosea caraganae TaxID=2763117 RepID=A0A370LAQ6_9HYPH|nr:flagellar hook-length control protein FliK [Bosea caraganae]RDJ27046.1 flagellar hook-length control protein FliK [Bosea caraganae]RDJ29063.1 flagellar hook-length control protein FliK [Bosea caraganae]